jgi:S-adenosylmethionine:tRNA ribosyltransferase-isomerase
MTTMPALHRTLREATVPPERRGIERDAVRMLVTQRAQRSHEHRSFLDLPAFAKPGDLLVVNDSATIPASLRATSADGEILKLHVATPIDSRVWMAEPRATVRVGDELRLPEGGSAVMIAPVDPERPRLWYAWFSLPLPMLAYLAKHGEPIRYGYIEERLPLADYQTLFARYPGSAEMPSAARPFTLRVLRDVRRAGAALAKITLHCGVSSFEQPERPASERFYVSPETADAVNAAKREGRRVIAVGTTVVRALESAVREGVVVACAGWTDLVIEPHTQLQCIDALITGFHDRGATHVSMLRAMLDDELLEDAYREAADEAYFIHEFGDVHLIV